MSKSRRRRHFRRWCRYLARTQAPIGNWHHRAMGCDDPRPSGYARAWDKVTLDDPDHWPWKPKLLNVPGERRGTSALMAHDSRERRRGESGP